MFTRINMSKVEIENKCTFMLKNLCDMSAEEILKMSTELFCLQQQEVELMQQPWVEPYDVLHLSQSDCLCLSQSDCLCLSQSDYLNLFNTLSIFLKNMDIVLAKNELFRVQKPRIVEEMMNTHKAFQERGVCDIVMEYTDGIAEIRDLCDDLDKRIIDINPDIFIILNAVVVNICYFDTPVFSSGFSSFLERRSTSAYDGAPHTPIEKVKRLIYIINHFPYAFYKTVRKYHDGCAEIALLMRATIK